MPWIFGTIFGIFFIIGSIIILNLLLLLIIVLATEEGDNIEDTLTEGWDDLTAWLATAWDDTTAWFDENFGAGLGAMEDPNISAEAKCQIRSDFIESKINDTIRCEDGKVKEIWDEAS